MSRVLVVEDSPTQAAEIQILLEEAGLQVELVTDGVQALESLRKVTPDLIVTDLEMPKMDGLALVEAVRADYPFVPVVLVSAHGSEEIASRALRAGAASYVPKRYLRRDLVPVVGQIVAMSAPDPDQARVQERLEEVRFRFVLENDESLVAPLIRRLETTVFKMGLCDRTGMIQIAVALREALVNAFDHGNLELDSELRQDDERVYTRLREQRRFLSPYQERRVQFDVCVTRSELVLKVRDEGPGFDPTALPDPSDPACLERIGGRGLTLMRALMDEVHHSANGNEITLVKRAERRPEGLAQKAGSPALLA